MSSSILARLRKWLGKTFLFAEGEPGAVYPFEKADLEKPVDFFTGIAGNGKVVLPHPFKPGAMVVHGGPYRRKPEALLGVRLEPSAPADDTLIVDFPIQDFGVPDYGALVQAVDEAYTRLLEEREIYVGCTGGFGRTGLFMACLLHKVMKDNHIPFPTGKGAILYLRENYTATAVETPDQQKMVVRYWEELQA